AGQDLGRLLLRERCFLRSQLGSSGRIEAALAHAGGATDAATEVVELGAPHVAAGRDLDLLDLRRVDGERSLHADAEGKLADREGLADTVALAADHNALEDLRTAAIALYHLEVDAHAVTGLEVGHAPQLGFFEAFDDL